jgi:dipeptide/tripeptide permease
MAADSDPAVTTGPEDAPVDDAMEERHWPPNEDLRHEAVTMALYVAICLLAALAVLANKVLTRGVVFEVVWTTTIGLAIAHLFAFLLAGRLIDGGRLTKGTRAATLAQMSGAFAVAALATAAVLLVLTSEELDAVRLDLAAIIGVIGYVIARNASKSRPRSALYAVAVAIVGLAVAGLKHWITH